MNKALPQAVLTVQKTYDYVRCLKSFVASLKTASLSNLESMKNLISNEKSTRNSLNKDFLRNSLNSQLELLHSSSSDNNPLFTNDQDISKGVVYLFGIFLLKHVVLQKVERIIKIILKQKEKLIRV